jgi:hypothetical protein
MKNGLLSLAMIFSLMSTGDLFAKNSNRTTVDHYKRHWTSSKLSHQNTLIKGQKLQVKALRRWVRAKNKKGELRE